MDAWFLALTTAVLAYAIYYFCFRGLNTFKDAGIACEQPMPIFGNQWPNLLGMRSMAENMQRAYYQDSRARYVGFFDMLTPVIILRDPELARTICIKHFDNFTDHRSFTKEEYEPLFSKSLFALRGNKWREVRHLLSPAFTTAKVKGMYELMEECARDFAAHFAAQKGTPTVDFKNAFTKYATDVIATCAFGISINSMENPNNDFLKFGKIATDFNSPLRAIKLLFMRSMPAVAYYLGLRFVPDDARKFFHDVIATTIKTRDEKGIRRPDMIQLLMDSRGRDSKDLTIDEMVSQAFIFFFAGFETVSSAMSFVAYEMAVNPGAQDKLRKEIEEVAKENNGRFPYDAVMKMEYLDAVVNEMLRKYPVAIFTDRVPTKDDYELPPAVEGGKPFVVKKGMNVWMPVYAYQHDPQYYEDPEKFDPERFLDADKKILGSNVYMPFGIGPRMCIGNRFALLEIKVMLCHFLLRCTLLPSEKTRIPFRLQKVGFNLGSADGYWFKVQPRPPVSFDAPRKQ